MTSQQNYICPMHPQERAEKPGNCPKCGMALIPESQAGHKDMDAMDHTEHHRIMAADFKKRFFVSLPLTVLVLSLSPKIQGWLGFSLDFALREPLLFALASIIVFYGAWPFFQAARGELKSRNYGMMTLVSLAVLSGYSFSLLGTFFFPLESFYWEISTLVLAFLFGHWLEMRAVLGTGGALRELAKLIPPIAHRFKGKKIEDVATEELVKGDLVLVKPGEKIPGDGVVVEGASAVNESMITGESRPVAKKEGSQVMGGTINSDGSLTVKITKTGTESALSQIMELIRQAQTTKPKVQSLADKAANWLTLIAVFVGIGTFVFWFFIFPQGAIFAATLAISVVVITCPHALGLAIPTVTTITTSLAARNGILIRDMKGLEMARDLDYVVFDKTGTLTEGEFVVTNFSSLEALRLAAAVEMHSQHPLGKAIVAAAQKKTLKIPDVKDFKSLPGKGVEGKVGTAKIEVKGPGVSVFKNGKLVGTIDLEDKIRDESRNAIKRLHDMGIKVAMLTGDKEEVAQNVGRELGIDTVFAQVLPEDKVNKIKELQKMGHKVAMVGDGVNDAPSLTQAHVGIAIGAGTSVAIESAEIVLVKDNPLDVVKAINLSRKTDSKMKQNLAWAAGYNFIAIPVAAGILFPFGIFLRPEWGALLMSASSVIVVVNALGLKGVDLA